MNSREYLIERLTELDCTMVEVCEPHPGNPSRNIIPILRTELLAALRMTQEPTPPPAPVTAADREAGKLRDVERTRSALVSFSTDVEDTRVLRIRFDRKHDEADRAAILAALNMAASPAMQPCPYCTGVRTGLPGNACENCMNTGVHPDDAAAFALHRIRARGEVLEAARAAVRDALYPKNDESDWTEFASIRAGCCISAEHAIRALANSKPIEGE